MNDNGEHVPVYIIVGQAWTDKNGQAERVHVLLTAADDDSAVHKSLQALARFRGISQKRYLRSGDRAVLPGEHIEPRGIGRSDGFIP